jgi:hypothetical protein
MTNLLAKLATVTVAAMILVGCACPGGRAILPSERIKQLEADLAACEEKLARCEASFATK